MPKGFSYSTEEVDSFLDILEEILPISTTAWKRVAEIHLTRYLKLNWSVKSLKRKFKELHNKKIPPEILFVPLLFAGRSVCVLK
jgi:hypothetical protein